MKKYKRSRFSHPTLQRTGRNERGTALGNNDGSRAADDEAGNLEDANKANEVFEILMGSEVAPRKKFIQTNAKHVQNLDV